MKIFKKLFAVLLLILILAFVGAWFYVRLYGKALIEESLKSALNRNVVLESVSYQFPLTLKAQNINIAHNVDDGQFFLAKNIIAQLSFEALVQRRLVFRSVIFIEPVVIIEKIKSEEDTVDVQERRYGIIVPPVQAEPNIAGDQSSVKSTQNKQEVVKINEFILKQGNIQYTNSSIDKDFSVAIEDVFLKVHNLTFPIEPGRSDFSISGRLVKKGNPLSGSTVEGSGWVDIVNRDMEAKIMVVEQDGTVGMTAEASSKNNDMSVKGDIKFQSIFPGMSGENSSDSGAVRDLISNALASAGVEIGAKFSFKTKMDDFRPEKISFSGSVLTR